ncbi:uncharacterized protein [Antedon mediterranea]|uniref:uncharacterized protein n=1 Tax=Antedon mediterranea TaxID=105859 RepID=UPI003AF510D8
MKQEPDKNEPFSCNDRVSKDMTRPRVHFRGTSEKRLSGNHKEVTEKVADEPKQKSECNAVWKPTDRDEENSPCRSPAGPSGDLYLQEQSLTKHGILPNISSGTKRTITSDTAITTKVKPRNSLLTQQRPPFVVGKHKQDPVPLSMKFGQNRAHSAFAPNVSNKFHQACFSQPQESILKSTLIKSRKKNLRMSTTENTNGENTVQKHDQHLSCIAEISKNNQSFMLFNDASTQSCFEKRKYFIEKHKQISRGILLDPLVENIIIKAENDEMVQGDLKKEKKNPCTELKDTERKTDSSYIKQVEMDSNNSRNDKVICQYKIKTKTSKHISSEENKMEIKDEVIENTDLLPQNDFNINNQPLQHSDLILEKLTFNVDYCNDKERFLTTDDQIEGEKESNTTMEVDKEHELPIEVVNNCEISDKQPDVLPNCEIDIQHENRKIEVSEEIETTDQCAEMEETEPAATVLAINYSANDTPKCNDALTTFSANQELNIDDKEDKVETTTGSSAEQICDIENDESVDVIQRFAISHNPIGRVKGNTAFDHAFDKLLTLEYYGNLLARLSKHSQIRLIEALNLVSRNDRVYNAALKSEASVELDKALDVFLGQFANSLMSYYNVAASEANASTFYKWFSQAENEMAADLTEAGDANDNF